MCGEFDWKLVKVEKLWKHSGLIETRSYFWYQIAKIFNQIILSLRYSIHKSKDPVNLNSHFQHWFLISFQSTSCMHFIVFFGRVSMLRRVRVFSVLVKKFFSFFRFPLLLCMFSAPILETMNLIQFLFLSPLYVYAMRWWMCVHTRRPTNDELEHETTIVVSWEGKIG